MISVNGYYDGNSIRMLEKIKVRKNQRIIITILDEDIYPEKSFVGKSAAGVLAKYANPDLIPLEDGAWERAVSDDHEEKTNLNRKG